MSMAGFFLARNKAEVEGMSTSGEKRISQTKDKAGKTKGVAVAFYDEERLRSAGNEGSLENFMYFFQRIQEIVSRIAKGDNK